MVRKKGPSEQESAKGGCQSALPASGRLKHLWISRGERARPGRSCEAAPEPKLRAPMGRRLPNHTAYWARMLDEGGRSHSSKFVYQVCPTTP